MLRVGALEGGYEVEMLKANPSMKTYAGPAFEKLERERLSQLAKPKAALKPPVYAPETSTVIGEPISKQVGHSLDGPSPISRAALTPTDVAAFVRAGPPVLQVAS